MQMSDLVYVYQYAWIQYIARIKCELYSHHDCIKFGSKLAFDEGCHHSPGDMLGLQRAIFRQDQFHHLFCKCSITLYILRILKVLIDQEVNVAIFRMPKDHGV